MLIDEFVDGRLVRRFHVLELQAHPDPSVAPGDTRLGFDVVLRTRQTKADARLAAFSSGVIVRMAMPPLPMFSVRAAAIVLSKRYATGMPSTTRGLLRRLK